MSAGDSDIFWAGIRVAGGVVVRHHDGGSVLLDRRLEDLRDAHSGRVEAAVVYLSDVQYPVTGITGHHQQVFLRAVGHARHQDRRGSRGRAVDLWAFILRFEQPTTERQGSFET